MRAVAVGFVASLIALAGCRRAPPPIRADLPDVADAHPESPLPDENGVVRRFAVDGDCHATDALYARVGATAKRVTGMGEGLSTDLPAEFARSEWTAFGGRFAWLESTGTNPETKRVRVWSPPTLPKATVATSELSEVGALRLDRTFAIFVQQGLWISEGVPPHGVHTASVEVIPIDGTARRFYGGVGNISILDATFAGSRILASESVITETSLIAIDPRTGDGVKLVTRPGEFWLRSTVADAHAAFFVTAAGVERLDLALHAGAPTVLLKLAPHEGFDELFLSPNALLVATIEADNRHLLLEIDPTSGAVRRSVVTDGRVTASFRGDGLSWCTEHALFTSP